MAFASTRLVLQVPYEKLRPQFRTQVEAFVKKARSVTGDVTAPPPKQQMTYPTLQHHPCKEYSQTHQVLEMGITII